MNTLSTKAGAAPAAAAADQAAPSPHGTSARITATEVPGHRRMSFLPRHFGRRMLQGEAAVYNWMKALCPQYSGGYWDFFELSNGGFYMRPSGEGRMQVCVDSNGFEGAVSPDAAGVIATLFALNYLCCGGAQDFVDAYYALRDFGIEHAEGAAILGAID